MSEFDLIESQIENELRELSFFVKDRNIDKHEKVFLTVCNSSKFGWAVTIQPYSTSDLISLTLEKNATGKYGNNVIFFFKQYYYLLDDLLSNRFKIKDQVNTILRDFSRYH